MGEISELSKKCVKHYLEEEKQPKVFTDADTTNYKLYLGIRFSIELGEVKEKDLGKDLAKAYKDLKPMKQYVNETLFKETMNWGILKISEKEAKKSEKKKAKKAKKKRLAEEVDEGRVVKIPVVIRQPSILEKVVNKIQDKMLDFSIWINDKLIEM